LQELSQDATVSKYASNLVYLTRSKSAQEIEARILYSILRKKPKRADRYWFLNISLLNEPFGMRYTLETLVPDVAYKVNFQLGFRIQPRINLLFRRVLEDMAAQGEIDITSRYATLQKHRLPGDFRFVVLDKVLSYDNQLSLRERIILQGYFLFNKLAITDQQAFGLDTSDVAVELVPLTIQPYRQLDLQRVVPAIQSDPVPETAVFEEALAHKI
jgi:KUP system potassium uptake protein